MNKQIEHQSYDTRFYPYAHQPRIGRVVHQFSGLKTCSFRQAEPVTDGSYCHQCFHVVLILNPYLIGGVLIGTESRAHLAYILVAVSDISEVKK